MEALEIKTLKAGDKFWAISGSYKPRSSSCTYCEGTGSITLKGKEFPCPANDHNYDEEWVPHVKEEVVETVVVEVWTVDEELYYQSDPSGQTIFSTKEEAEAYMVKENA